MTTQEHLRKLIFGVSPEDPSANNGHHNVVTEQLAKLYDEYYASCAPSLEAIHAVLGVRSLVPEDFERRWGVVFPDFQTVIMLRGQGTLEYITQNLIDKTTFDPQFAVLALQAMCKKHNLNNFRTPTGHGHDIVYSVKPLDDRYGFDNNLYIPATVGYYGIVGKSGAR